MESFGENQLNEIRNEFSNPNDIRGQQEDLGHNFDQVGEDFFEVQSVQSVPHIEYGRAFLHINYKNLERMSKLDIYQSYRKMLQRSYCRTSHWLLLTLLLLYFLLSFVYFALTQIYNNFSLILICIFVLRLINIFLLLLLVANFQHCYLQTLWRFIFVTVGFVIVAPSYL